MKIVYGFMFLIFSVIQSEDLQVAVHVKQTQKVPLGLALVGKVDESMQHMVDRLQKDLQHSGQCQVSVKKIPSLKKQKDLTKHFAQDVFLAVFISKKEDQYTWRLYDLLSAEMIDGKTINAQEQSYHKTAHEIADQLWPVLMNNTSSFRSKIAYCKQVWKKSNGREKPFKQIWIADFDGSNPKLFIDIPTVSIAPRWSQQEDCPLLFYSENTLSNVQLVMSNMFGKRKTVCCFDGLNMQPTFSPTAQEVVFCLSKDGSSQLYHSYVNALNKKRIFERLTDNDGNNIAPCFIDDNHVVFVSDFETRRPQLYIMNVSSKRLKRITDGGYCACPAYCKANNKLVYSKMVDGAMQLFEYDCGNNEHRQLTKGPGSKEEPTWSSCGNYILFGMNEGLCSRIAQLNLITGKVRYITKEGEHCTYPACSPVYDKFVGILK